MQNFSYRPEIDGLRALSVIAVIIFHSDFNVLNGGFYGVDIFFTISGYLITSIILKDKELNKFSILNFYQRRARRILPILLLVITICFIISYFILSLQHLKEFSHSALFASFFVSNYYFDSVTGYFDLRSELKPLLHTWSLSIEEQFYIIFPIIMLFYNNNRKNIYLIFFILITLTSLSLSQWSGNISFHYPFIIEDVKFYNSDYWTSFFLPIGRIWELSVGSLIAMILFNNDKPRFFNNLLSIFGFSLICFSFIGIDKLKPNPSFYNFIPVFGTILIIIFINQNTILYKFLSNKFLVGIGLISYSLYLVHYPLFAFSRYINLEDLSTLQNIIIIFLTFFISYFSWRFIEKKFREFNFINVKKIIYFLSIFYLIIIILFIYSLNLNINKSNQIEKIYNNFIFDNKFLADKKQDFLIENIKTSFDNDRKKSVLIVGDSFARDLFLALHTNRNKFLDFEFALYNSKDLNKDNWKQFNIEVFSNLHSGQVNESQMFYNSKVFKDAEIILISSRYHRQHYDIDALQKLVFELEKTNKKLIVVSNSAEFFTYADPAYEIISRFEKSNSKKIEKEILENHMYRILDKSIIEEVNPKYLNFAKKNKLVFLDKVEIACDLNENKCDIFDDDGYKLYFDYGHYTLEGVKYFGEKIYQNNWLKF